MITFFIKYKKLQTGRNLNYFSFKILNCIESNISSKYLMLKYLTQIFVIRIIIRINRKSNYEGVKLLKSYSSREIICQLKADGWYLMNSVGSHQQYKHPTKKSKVTVPHPKKDLPLKTVKSIAEQAGIILK